MVRPRKLPAVDGSKCAVFVYLTGRNYGCRLISRRHKGASLRMLTRGPRIGPPPLLLPGRKNDSSVLFVYVHGALYSNPLHSTCRAHTVRRAQLQA